MLIYLNLCLHFFLQCYFYPMLPLPPLCLSTVVSFFPFSSLHPGLWLL